MTTVDVGAGLASFLPQLGFRPIRLRLRLRRWMLAGGRMRRIDLGGWRRGSLLASTSQRLACFANRSVDRNRNKFDLGAKLLSQKQFSLWRLMRGVLIAAIVASAMTPFIQKADKIFANPTIFVVAMALVFLIQAPILFLPHFIDWLLGNKPNESEED